MEISVPQNHGLPSLSKSRDAKRRSSGRTFLSGTLTLMIDSYNPLSPYPSNQTGLGFKSS